MFTSRLRCLEGLEDGQAEDRQLRPASNTGAPLGAVGSTPTLSARRDVVLASTVIAWLWKANDLILILVVLHLLSSLAPVAQKQSNRLLSGGLGWQNPSGARCRQDCLHKQES